MPDEDGGQAAVAEGTETAAATSVLGPDGKLGEGWTENLPEDIKGEVVLSRFKDIGTLARSFVHANRMVSKDKVVLPTEKSTEAEWGEFYERLGRPKTVEDYKLDAPDALKDFVDPEVVKGYKGLFHKIGLNQKQVDALWAMEQARIEKGIKEMESAREAEQRDAERSLREKWGAAYDQRLHLANRMIAENVADEAAKKELLAAIGNSPHVADFLANIAAKFIEHKVIPSEALIPTPSDLMAKRAELMAAPAFLDKKHPEHDIVVQKVFRLTEQMSQQKQGRAG